MESAVLYPICLDSPEVCLGGKTSVKGGLPGQLFEYALLACDHFGCQMRVGRIPVLDGAICDESRSAARQTDFVTKHGLPAFLFQDVGMGFKDADHLLFSGQVLAQDHPLPGLLDDLLHEIKIAGEALGQGPPPPVKPHNDLKRFTVQVLAMPDELSVKAFSMLGVFWCN